MTNRKPKSQWNGEAEIWINEERQLTATVQLTKYEELTRCRRGSISEEGSHGEDSSSALSVRP